MSKEYRMVEVCDNCGELLEHCICDEEVPNCDDCNECCECEEDEPDESEQEEFRLIGEAIDKIFEVFPCPDCVSETVIDLVLKFKEIGWKDHQDYIREMNED
jgi:hypothetical protein